jgi:hypothetical protein
LVTAIAAVGGLSLILSSFVFGLRLIWVSRKTRGLPEFCIGAGLFLNGGLGYVCSTLANAIPDLSDETKVGLLTVHMLAATVGQGCIALFTWKVFRPTSVWARTGAILIFMGYSTLFVWQVVTPGILAYANDFSGIWDMTLHLAKINLLWAGIESLLYYLKLRKRVSLELADPAVANRVLMWSIAILSAASVTIAIWVLEIMSIPTKGAEGLVYTALVVGPLGPITAVCMWLAFTPPKRYQHWIAEMSVAAEA